MNWLVNILGFINALPLTVVSLLWILPMWMIGILKPIFTRRNLEILSLPMELKTSCHWIESWDSIRGFSCGAWLVVRDVENQQVIRHEEMHIMQQYLLGIFMPIVYLAHSLIILLFYPKRNWYRDNIFEKIARAWAKED